MSAKFTKGKWEYGVRKDGSIWFSIGDPSSGPHYQFDLPTTEANARLMAAAPDMFAALDKLARLGNGFEYGNSEGNIIAQAAILQALTRGEG